MGLFAVNLDAYESDLTSIDDPAESRARLGRPPSFAYADDTAALSEGGRGGGAWKLWTAMLVVVLAIALAEPYFANRISARLFAKPGLRGFGVAEGERRVRPPLASPRQPLSASSARPLPCRRAAKRLELRVRRNEGRKRGSRTCRRPSTENC